MVNLLHNPDDWLESLIEPLTIHCRPISELEHAQLQHWHRSADPVRYRRARILVLAAQGKPCRQIARILGLHPQTVRDCIKAFNKGRLSDIQPLPRSGGRKPKFTQQTGDAIVHLLRHKPEQYGINSGAWTLRDLVAILVREGFVESISLEGVRQLLLRQGFTLQQAKRWLTSSDRKDGRYLLKKSVATG